MFRVSADYPTHHIAVGAQTDRSRILPEPETRSTAKLEVLARQRAWLQELTKQSGLKPSAIAGRSGVSDTTLTRLLNKDDYRHTLTQITIDRIKKAFGVPGPEEFATGQKGMIGFGEAERVIARQEPKGLARLLDALLDGRTLIEAWRLRTDALALGGYLAGDIVLVDLDRAPRPQDAVCAQIQDWARGGAETVFRIFDPPFLVAAAHDRTGFKPLLIDHDRVIIKGVVIESLRPHPLSMMR